MYYGTVTCADKYFFESVVFVQLFKLGPLQFICVSDNSDSVKEVRDWFWEVICFVSSSQRV